MSMTSASHMGGLRNSGTAHERGGQGGVCVYVYGWVSACARACVCPSVWESTCVGARTFVCVCLSVWVGECICVCLGQCLRQVRPGPAVFSSESCCMYAQVCLCVIIMCLLCV